MAENNTNNNENSNNESNANELNNAQSTGIPSVAGSKSKTQKKAGFLLLVAAIVLGAALLLMANNSSDDKKEDAQAQNTQQDQKVEGLTSDKELTKVTIPTRDEERARREAELLRQQQLAAQAKSNLPIQLQENVGSSSQNTNTQQVVRYDSNGKPLPTLEELKFAAPMMGSGQNSSSSNNASANSGKNDNGFFVPQYATGEQPETPTHLRKDLASQLEAIETPQAYAGKIKNRNMTLPKGTLIECILETRVDTSTPGMTSCVVPRDVYSQNGKVLLVERGTKAVGEYQGSVQNGLERIFMLWTELRTPEGIVIPISSPTTDNLGAAGMGGWVDHHWWKRFGNALMFSIVADGFEFGMAKAQSSTNNANVTYNNTDAGMTEIIKAAMEQSGKIPPTLIKNQGERVGIFVARDLNFETVYKLRKEVSAYEFTE